MPHEVIAVIPARGGSKGVPGKNLREVAGVPLVARAVRAALAAASVDLVVVSTDDAEIAATAEAAGAEVIDRPADLSGDTASSESALLHALDALEADERMPEVLVFVQATSPFIDPSDIDAAVAEVRHGDADVVFSAVESHAFLWRHTSRGAAGVNHSSGARLRRQDREAEYRETGAFYVMRADRFRTAEHRFFGRIGFRLVPDAHALEIDTPADLALADALAAVVSPSALVPAVPCIDVDAVVTDFDGVHTDDTAYVGSDGTERVRVSRSDGHGVKMLREAGVPMLILSVEQNPVVAARAAKLGVDVVHGVRDKAPELVAWAERRGVPLERIAYVGNDVGDLGCLRLVGWPVVVADAAPEALALARHVLTKAGGDGAVRELSDLVLGARAAAEVRSTDQPALAGAIWY